MSSNLLWHPRKVLTAKDSNLRPIILVVQFIVFQNPFFSPEPEKTTRYGMMKVCATVILGLYLGAAIRFVNILKDLEQDKHQIFPPGIRAESHIKTFSNSWLFPGEWTNYTHKIRQRNKSIFYSWTMAAWLEENELFTVEDDDDWYYFSFYIFQCHDEFPTEKWNRIRIKGAKMEKSVLFPLCDSH